MNRRGFLRLGAAGAASLAVGGCTSLTLLDWLSPAAAGPVERDVAFGPDPRQRMDIYAPASGAPRAALLFLYGGAWRTGERDQYRFVGEALTRAGYLAAVADYRLAPVHRFPAFVEDAASAFAALHRRLGPGRPPCHLLGHSAGAYNAVMVALDPRYLAAHGLDRSAIAGVIGVSGPYRFDSRRPWILASAFGDADPEVSQPVRFGDPAVPPLLLINGAEDRFVSPRDAEALAARVVARGGRARAVVYDGRGHMDSMLGLSSRFDFDGRLMADIDRFTAGSG